jgi:hypothetical protein
VFETFGEGGEGRKEGRRWPRADAAMEMWDAIILARC